MADGAAARAVAAEDALEAESVYVRHEQAAALAP